MYSNPNAHLGGNAQGPGQQQYGSPFGSNPPQPGAGQQQPGPFAPQPTGFGQAPLQQQYTGFPMQPQATGLPQQQQQQQPPMPLQNQYTGFGGSPGPQGLSNAPPVPSIPSQYQNQFQQQPQQHQPQPQAQQQQPQPQQFQFSQPTGFSPSQMNPVAPPPPASAPAPTQKPQPTGFTQMAASFQTGQSTTAPTPKKTNKIPNIRLSFITAQDQSKFETLFQTSVGDDGTTMSGDKARDLLLRSRLDGDTLSQIWYVAPRTVGSPHFMTHCLTLHSQDVGRHYALRPVALPRVCPGHVPMQPQDHRKAASDRFAGEYQE